MVRTQLPDCECFDECSQPAAFYGDEPEFESSTQSGAFATQRLDDKGRPAVKMVVDSLVQSAFASDGSSDMCHPALRVVNYVDALKMGTVSSLSPLTGKRIKGDLTSCFSLALIVFGSPLIFHLERVRGRIKRRCYVDQSGSSGPCGCG
jgi:hypothetical protein